VPKTDRLETDGTILVATDRTI